LGLVQAKTAMFKTKLINQTKSRQIAKLIQEIETEKEKETLLQLLPEYSILNKSIYANA